MSSYVYDPVDCDFISINAPPRCTTCVPMDDASRAVLQDTVQRRIWNTSRLSSSHYSNTLSTQHILGTSSNEPKVEYANVNWNQSSDRAVPSIQTAYVPTRANSRHSSKTALRPGALAPAGVGVDIKHGSYDRYLAKRKASALRTRGKNTIQSCECPAPPVPINPFD
jgi:hypothetical protein